jgi:hypothetical protein
MGWPRRVRGQSQPRSHPPEGMRQWPGKLAPAPGASTSVAGVVTSPNGLAVPTLNMQKARKPPHIEEIDSSPTSEQRSRPREDCRINR